MFPPNTKVLVVDDMLTMRKIVKKCLAEAGLKDVTEAADGAIALTEIENAYKGNAPFQLILSDWNMPNMQGIELLKKVRANPDFKKLPFVLITAEADREQVAEALTAGVTSYIVKPFTAEKLLQVLQKVYAIASKGK